MVDVRQASAQSNNQYLISWRMWKVADRFIYSMYGCRKDTSSFDHIQNGHKVIKSDILTQNRKAWEKYWLLSTGFMWYDMNVINLYAKDRSSYFSKENNSFQTKSSLTKPPFSYRYLILMRIYYFWFNLFFFLYSKVRTMFQNSILPMH